MTIIFHYKENDNVLCLTEANSLNVSFYSDAHYVFVIPITKNNLKTLIKIIGGPEI